MQAPYQIPLRSILSGKAKVYAAGIPMKRNAQVKSMAALPTIPEPLIKPY